MTRRIAPLLAACLVIVGLAAVPAPAYVPWDTHVFFLESLTRDMLKLLPRAMGKYIYQNRYDFFRGMTVMTRDIRFGPYKMKDLEEIRREAYARLHRDIPYCVQALKSGDIKLDTSANNLSGRLGMIAYSIMLLKTPEFPDLEYYEKFSRALDEVIVDDVIDVWVYYDGYPDFCSLGELLERLKAENMPAFKHVRNDNYPGFMKQDVYAMFRAPDKHDMYMILTNRDMNEIYSNIINCILDAFVYIWKCSGMDLQHPSYAAPPGTIVERPSRRRILSAGTLARPVPLRPLGIMEEIELAAPGPSATPSVATPEAPPAPEQE
jgi:hypothetical protein